MAVLGLTSGVQDDRRVQRHVLWCKVFSVYCIGTELSGSLNRPPALYRLKRKTHTRINGPRMGFFIFGKAPTASP